MPYAETKSSNEELSEKDIEESFEELWATLNEHQND